MVFFCLFEGVNEEEGCTIRAMVGSESMLGWVQGVVCFPGVSDAIREDTGS